jgi:hypothetical protein
MTGKYEPLERYLRGLPVSQEHVPLTFGFIEQLLNESLAVSAQIASEGQKNMRKLAEQRLSGD